MVDTFGLSDVGCIRELNEDCFCIHGFEEDKKGFCVLADGMGGHNAGEVASQNAVRFIDDILSKLLSGEVKEKIPKVLTQAVDKANERVYRMSVESSEHNGMGTTVVVAYTEDETVYIANVGDSRAYVIRNDEIRQLTCDHSVVEELVKSGTITRDEARVHPQRNIITRAVGTEPTVCTDIFEYEYKAGDIMILCSDGLSSMLEDKLIYEIVKREETSENTVCKLVEAAKISGGLDNITVICIRF